MKNNPTLVLILNVLYIETVILKQNQAFIAGITVEEFLE